MNKLLALDQALNTTGYAIYVDGSLNSFNKFTTSDGIETPKKLQEIREFVIQLLNAEKPNEVAIEEIQLQQIPGTDQYGNIETFKKLAYVQATILEVLAERDIKYHIVSSASWKSTCGIRGRVRAEQKKNAQAYVLNEFGVKAIQDIVDAICIGKHVILEEGKEINWG